MWSRNSSMSTVIVFIFSTMLCVVAAICIVMLCIFSIVSMEVCMSLACFSMLAMTLSM